MDIYTHWFLVKDLLRPARLHSVVSQIISHDVPNSYNFLFFCITLENDDGDAIIRNNVFTPA